MGTKLSSLPNLRKKPTPVKGSSGQRAYIRKQYYNPNKHDPNYKALNPATEQLKKLESIINTEPPGELVRGQLSETDQGCCGTQFFRDDKLNVYYWKQKNREMTGLRSNVPGNYAGREIAAYEMSKALHIEGMVPPTIMYSPKVDGLKSSEGSLQMGVRTHGSEYGLKDFYAANVVPGHDTYDNNGLGKLFDEIENVPDSFAFDVVIGNTDRHTGNQFIGKDDGDRKYMINIDNGLSFPNTYHTRFDSYWGNNEYRFFTPVAENSKHKDSQISPVMSNSILTIPKDVVKMIGKKSGLAADEIDSTQKRISVLRDGARKKIKEMSLFLRKSSLSEAGLKTRKSVILDKSRLTCGEMYDIIKNRFDDYSGSSDRGAARVISPPSTTKLRRIEERRIELQAERRTR